MHEVLVNRLGGLSLPRKSVVRLTDRPDMTLDVYRGRKTTIQQQLSTDGSSYYDRDSLTVGDLKKMTEDLFSMRLTIFGVGSFNFGGGNSRGSTNYEEEGESLFFK